MNTAISTTVRMTASISAASVVLASMTAGGAVSPPSTVSPEMQLMADATALILCGTTCPTPDANVIDTVRKQYIAPTHPGQDMDYVAVTAPMEFWPITGLFRLLGLTLGPSSMFGPGGPAWPDEPLWKISGLFDLTADKSLEQGAASLETAIAAHSEDDLVIYGLSQGAGVANVVKKQLAQQYPAGTTAPDIDFVLSGDPNLPNGGLMSRFPGLHIPIINLSFNGAAATDTQFKTVEINRQYDGFTDFPLYPLKLISTVNALLGVVYEHMYSFDVSLPANPETSPAFQGTHGDTSYYFFASPDLPLFGPLRTLGIPEKLIDVVEPVFRVLVELGYDRSIPAWEPTAARLVPKHEPGKFAADLADAIHEGIDNARALVGLAPITRESGSVTRLATASTVASARPRPQPVRQLLQAATSGPAAKVHDIHTMSAVSPGASSPSTTSLATPQLSAPSEPAGTAVRAGRSGSIAPPQPTGRAHRDHGDKAASRKPTGAAAGARTAASTHPPQ